MLRVKIKRVFTFALAGLSMVAYQNCGENFQPASELAETGLQPTGGNSQTTSAQLVKAYVTANCLGCHSGGSPSGNYSVATYSALISNQHVVPFQPMQSSFYLRMLDNTMPPGSPPSNAEKAMIQEWIATGAADFYSVTAANPTPTPSPPTPTFSWINANILKPKCLSCHGTTGAKGGYSVASYATTMNGVLPFDAAESKLYKSVADNSMPENASPLSAAEKNVILQWINAGAANN